MTFAQAIRGLLPKSLFGRLLVIIVAPMILLQLSAAAVFFERHLDSVTKRMARTVVGDINYIARTYQAADDIGARARLLATANATMNLNAIVLPLTALPAGNWDPDRSEQLMISVLKEEIEVPSTIERIDARKAYALYVQLPDQVLKVFVPFNRFTSATARIVVLWTMGSALLLVTIAVLFMRNQMRPIARLAEAAERLGKGQDVEDFHPAGAREVRQASAAFLEMQDRIRRQIRQRTEMLAGVSHDLRTPLTRIKLSLALLEESAETKEILSDVEEMEGMVEGYLAFARGAQDEALVETDLNALLRSVADSAQRQGGDVDVAGKTPINVLLRPQAFRRCITNLVNNALRFSNRTRIEAHLQADGVTVNIDDDGPGIPEVEREEVFRPFYRLEHSRNRDTGGIGLGLAIARDIIRGQGGDVRLHQSPLGGLRAEIWLPS